MNVFWVLTEKFIRIGLGIVLMGWIFRYLGPQNLGNLQYARSIIVLFAPFALVHIGNIVSRDLILYPKLNNTLLGTAFVLRIIGIFLFCIAIGIGIQFMNNTSEQKSMIFVFIVEFIVSIFFITGTYFHIKALNKYMTYSHLIALSVNYLFKIWLVLNQYDTIYFAWSFVLDNVIAASFYIYFYSKYGGNIFKWKFDFSLAKKIFITSLPYLFSSMVVTLYARIDLVMIKSLINLETVGYYAAALRIIEPCFLIPGMIVRSLVPAVINAKKYDYTKYIRRIQKLYELVIIIFLIISLFIAIFCNEIISIIYGEQFLPSARILSSYVLCGFITGTNGVRNTWILSENLQKYSFFLCIIGGIFNIGLNLFLVSKYEIMGIVYGTLFAHILTFFSTAFLPKIRPSFFMILKAYSNVFLLRFLKKGYFKNL